MTAETVPIDSIQVESRFRQDLGDLDGLAASIRDVGLLCPVGIDQRRRLVYGQRRLDACRRLGWADIPAVTLTHLDDAVARLKAERDENTCRLDMTPAEKAALGRALEELERPAAHARRTGTLRHGNSQVSPVTENLQDEAGGAVRDLVGAAVGMSGPIYQRAKAVVAMAEEGRTPAGDPLTEEQRAVAREAYDDMERTGKITPAYNKARSALNGAPPAPAVAETATAPGPALRRRGPRRDPAEIVERIVEELDAIVGIVLPGIPDDYEFDAAEAKSWTPSLRRSIAALNRLKKRLEDQQ